MESRKLNERDRGVLRVLWLTLLLNALVAATKIIVGVITGRLTVTADGFHSLLDGANNVIGIVAITLSARPADEDHPYGHRKFENVAAMAIGGFILLVAWEIGDHIIRTLISHIRNGSDLAPEAVDPLLIGMVAATLLINIAVSAYETWQGRKLKSPLLIADSSHTFSDSLVTLLSLASLFIGRLAWWIDPLLATGVLAFLLVAAWKIIWGNLSAFTDRAFLDPLEVRDIVEHIDGVEATSRIRSHGTENDVHLDLIIGVSGSLTAREVEEIERAVRKALRAHFPNLSMIGIHHEAIEN